MRTTNSGLQKLSRMSECKQRFGIRKLTVGTVSVLLGTTLWLGRNATVAHAADNDVDNAEGVKQTTNSNVATPHVDENTQVKVEASHVDETTQPKAETTNVDVNTQPKVEATQASANTPAKTEVSSQNNVASTKIPANSVKTGDNTTNQQSSAAAQVTSNNSNKTNVEQTEKSNKNEQTTTILNVAANKSALVKGNQTLIRQARALEQSNVETDSDNGGFDSDKWGNLDISDWQGEENQDGIYQLTDYTGDYDHIIVPNGADFRNAGTDVDQVGVTSDFMHRLFMGADSDSATVAFSGTDDEKVKAIDDEDTKHPGDWSNTWGHGPENDQVQDPEDQETQATARLAYFDGSNLDVSGVTNMSYMFADNNLDDISSLADWDTSNVKNTQSMFWHNKISDLSPVSDWNIGNMTGMDSMFATNQISDLTPVSNWNTSNVTDMKNLFFKNSISDLTPISGWNTSSVDNMDGMFQHNPITRADFSGWDFSHLVRKDYHQTKKPYSTLDGFIDSDARAIVNMGSNDTLPDWVLDSQIKDDDDSTTDEDTELRNDSIFSTSNGNHLILTSDSKLLNNPNNAHNTITFSNSDESINDTVDMPVFIDSSFDTVLDDVKSLADQKVNDEETKIGSRYNIGIDSSVDQNDAISLANAKYDITPAPVTPVDPDTPTNPTNPSTPEVRITFNDVDPNAAQDSDDVKSLLATPIVLSQKDPDNDDIDLSNVTIPENFVLAESLPTDKKYGVDTAVVLDVRHILQDVSDTDPNAKTTVKRTIIVTEPNKGDQDMSQTLTLHRSAMKDLVTNNVEYGTWNTSSFAEVAVPKVENYTPSQETVPAVETVTADYIDPNIHVVYTVNNSDDSTQIISYVRDDNGAEVGQQVVSGKVGDTFQITPELPDGWERTKDKPVNITIRPNGEGTVIVVPVDPLKVTINPDDLPAGKEIWGTNEHDVSNADVLAGTKSKYSKRDVTYNDLHGAVSRTVEIMNPDGNLAPESRVQLVKFKRSAIINAIDGSVTFTNWIPDGKTSLSEIDVPVIAGYTPTQTKVDQVDNISTDYVDPRIFITYTGNKNSQSIVYKDQNGNVIGKQTIDGQNGQTVNVNAAIPDGWKVLNNEIIPKEITIKPNNSDINITVKATTSVVDPNEVDKDKPISKDAVISGTKNKHLEHDITYNDLHKDVTRTVTINRPDGVVVPVTQTVHFVRSANVDNTTGKITYTNWTAEDNDNFAKVDVPQIDGYTANESNVGQVANVTSDYADPKISVTYTPKDVTKTITFVDGKGNVIGKQTVAGKTNEVKDVTLKAPDGWQLDSDKALNKVTLDTNNDPISVFVEPKTALIKSDEVKQNQSFTKNDVLPGTESKHANKDITYGDLHKSVDRKIEITMPDGSQKTINQTVYFERNATVNTATGDVNFGNWNVVGADKLDKADIPQIENYIPSGDAFAINYLNYDEDPKDVKITYVADTPVNRLAVAKQNLASVQDAKNELKDNLAKLEQEQDSIVKQDKAIQDEYNAKKEQNKVLLVAADAAESALDEEIADHSSDVNLAKADKVVNDFFNQINDKKNVLSAQNKKLSDLNQNKASVEKKVNDLNDSLNKVSDEIAVKQKEIEADQDEINKLSVSAETDFNLSDKYIKYIKGYNSQLDKEYDQTYKDAYNDIYNKEYEAYKKQYPESIYGKEQIERLAKSNAENKAKAGASQKAVTAVKNLIKKLTPDFYDNMKNW